MAVSNEMMKDMYTRMLRIRDFENATSRLYAEGKIPGFCHLYIGEEAVATGVCECLTDEDYITSTHRGHGHIIAKGGDMRLMMAELFGRATGYCHGKGGSMHIADRDKGILGANGIVGAGQCICARRIRSASASSATRPRTRAHSMNHSISHRCGSFRSCSCVRTISTAYPSVRSTIRR